MTAAGSVERHVGLPLIGKNLPPRALVCTSPRMSSIVARSGPRFSRCHPKKTRPTKMSDALRRGYARLFDEDVPERRRLWECALCNYPNAEPTICADVCSWEPMPMFAPGYFDMIWASPPCAEYALTRRPRRLEEGDRTAIRTLELIRDLRPRFWCIENPQTGC